VYQWRWTSGSTSMGEGRAVAGLARGIERFDTLSGARVAAQAIYDHGQWRVQFRRALASADTASELQFATARAIPVAFFAWDGGNGEAGTRMAVSTWYFLALDTPTPVSVFVSPIAATLLTLGLGLMLIKRAQQRSAA